MIEIYQKVVLLIGSSSRERFMQFTGGVGTALTAAMLAAAPANAATIIQNFNLSSGGSFALQQFDASLGTLESVDVAINALARRNVVNPEPGPGANLFSIRGFATLSSADVGAPVLPSWEIITTDNQNKFNSPYELIAGGPTQTTNFSTGLASFTGSSMFNYVLTGGIDILDPTAPYGATLRNDARAAISVTYNFREAVAAVPEPSTWAMMILGFGIVGAAMRRRAGRGAALAC